MSVASSSAMFAERSGQLLALLHANDVKEQRVADGPIVVTGIGGSEGPARLLAQAMLAQGRACRFVPITGINDSLEARSLILFSQGLSPNARLALAGSRHIEERWLVTGCVDKSPELAAFEQSGGRILRHAPHIEDGMLVRVLAPTMAIDTGLRAFAGLARPENFFLALEAAAARGAKLAESCSAETFSNPWAFITSGDIHDSCHGLRWKWLETLGVCDPPLYDVLNFAHGPLQCWHGQQLTLLALRTQCAHWQALEATAERVGYKLLNLTSELPPPWTFFEHDIALNAILCRALALGVGHGVPWRGQGDDVALYQLGAS